MEKWKKATNFDETYLDYMTRKSVVLSVGLTFRLTSYFLQVFFVWYTRVDVFTSLLKCYEECATRFVKDGSRNEKKHFSTFQ